MLLHPERSKQKPTPPPFPWGQGSMSWHGRIWKLAYRDVDGNIIYENSRTSDPREAQRILALRSLPRARAMVKLLENILDGEAYPQKTAASGRNDSAAQNSRSRANRKKPAQAAGTRGTNSRPRSAGKGEK